MEAKITKTGKLSILLTEEEKIKLYAELWSSSFTSFSHLVCEHIFIADRKIKDKVVALIESED